MDLFADLAPTLEELRANVAAVLPRVAVTIVVLVAGWLLATLLRALVRRVLSGVTKKLPPGRTRDAWSLAVGQRGAASAVASAIYWLVVIATLMVATETIGLPLLTAWLAALATYVPRVILAVAVVVGSVVAGTFAGEAATRVFTKLGPQQSRQLDRMIRGGLITVGLLVAAGQLGLDVSFLSAVFLIVIAAALGGAALAFGLGARGEIANILAMHYVQQSYAVGESIRVGSEHGRIIRTSATTVFLESDAGEVAVPGHVFSDQPCVRLDGVDDDT